MPNYQEVPTVTTTYSETPRPTVSEYGYLLTQEGGYLLRPEGGRIIIEETKRTTDVYAPNTPYTFINKPT